MVTRHSWRTVSPPTPESKTPTGRASITRHRKWAIAFALVVRVRLVTVLAVAALACAGAAAFSGPAAAEGSGWTAVTIAASDATPLSCAYRIPGGSAPAGG